MSQPCSMHGYYMFACFAISYVSGSGSKLIQRNGTPLKYPAIPISWTEEMGKGGARRTSIPEANFDQIYHVLDLQIHKLGIKKGSVFHMYSHLSKTNAADARGLADNSDMLTQLLKIAPACEIPASLLSRVFKHLLLKWQGLNNGPFHFQMTCSLAPKRTKSPPCCFICGGS